METAETKNGVGEIEIVTNAVLAPPVHSSKQPKSLAHMDEHDRYQQDRAKQL